jgi:hypothetical protein
MLRTLICCVPLILACGSVAAEEPSKSEAASQKPAAKEKEEANKPASKADAEKELTGMSILGNDEAPKSLVIVPWKSSQLGDAPGLSKLLDDSTQPVDKDVFMRELAYYQIKSDSK